MSPKIFFAITTYNSPACLAVLIPREASPCVVTLWLDADYIEQQTGIKTCGYRFPQGSLAANLIEKIQSYGVGKPKIGFERYFVGFSLYDELRGAFDERDFLNASDLFYRTRAIKDNSEIDYMRQAGQLVDLGMAAAVSSMACGVTELDVLAEAEFAMLKAGSGGSPFRPQVVSGNRTLLTHPCASEKKVASGEVVVVHLGATFRGYCAKSCRTVVVGEVGTGVRKTYELLLQAQMAALKVLRPGKTVGEVDAAARKVICEAGLSEYFLDIIGYGVGIRQSEFFPIIGKGRTEIVQAGMVVDLLLSTIYRLDIGGPRVTDCILVGEECNEWLTNYPRQLIEK